MVPYVCRYLYGRCTCLRVLLSLFAPLLGAEGSECLQEVVKFELQCCQTWFENN